MSEQILNEIRRLASENDGKPPGKQMFARVTGITEGKWSGRLWARWSDALAEAGFMPNEKQVRLESSAMLLKVAELWRQLGRAPTHSEMKLRRRSDPTFPNSNTLSNHFPTNAGLIHALRELAASEGYGDLLPMLPDELKPPEPHQAPAQEGSVYLLKSGANYRIGCTANLERRMKEIRVALPEPVTIVHSIKTDDQFGIENYWHRRFAARRIREGADWFRLTGEDVRAFRRRRFQ